jgi:hypothetical protein
MNVVTFVSEGCERRYCTYIAWQGRDNKWTASWMPCDTAAAFILNELTVLLFGETTAVLKQLLQQTLCAVCHYPQYTYC